MSRILIATTIVVAPAFFVGPASAQCLSSAPNVLTCAADDDAGVNLPGVGDLTIEVAPGVTVSAPTDADTIVADDDLTVDNLGSILSAGAGKAIDADNDLTVSNAGLIESDDEAINAADDAEIVNGPDGVIRSLADRAIDLRDDATITNEGLIAAAGEGIEVRDRATITNAATGVIEALDDALNPEEDVTIDNYGRIANIQTQADIDAGAEAQDAIDVNSGVIRNYAGAEISSTFGDAIDFDPSTANFATVVNEGVIRGGNFAVETQSADTQQQIIVNEAGGLIEGVSGLALNLRGGGDRYDHYAGATIIGGADFGAGQDQLNILGGDGRLGGVGAVFDGGADDDFAGFLVEITDLGAIKPLSDGLTYDFLFTGGPSPFQIALRNWENFVFGANADQYSLEEVLTLVPPAPVPLPATAPLLGAALAGFVLRALTRSATRGAARRARV